MDEIENLQEIADELRLGNYHNNDGPLVNSAAFIKLQQLALAQRPTSEANYAEERPADEPFHIEADIYDSGDYAKLLVIPSAGTYIIITNNEHVATLVKSCDAPECWEQVDGTLDDELVQELGIQIDNFMEAL